MDRREREHYDDNDRDFNRNAGYDRNDEHYHRARNLTNEFERHYQHDHGHSRGEQPIRRSYHEGNDLGDMYERRMQESGRSGWSTGREHEESRSGNRNFDRSMSSERDRFGNFQDDYRDIRHMGSSDRNPNQGGWQSNWRDNPNRDDVQRGYGISDYAGTSDRYNTLGSDSNRGSYGQHGQSGSRGQYGSERYSGGMGENFPTSNRGVPDTTYGMGSHSDSYGTGSSYGGSNYGGGTGYSGGHRGGSFGNSSYGSSSGNYGGYGSMGSGTYGGRSSYGRDRTSHNSDRGTNELGGF